MFINMSEQGREWLWTTAPPSGERLQFSLEEQQKHVFRFF